MMPVLQSAINPAWNGDEGLVSGFFERIRAEVRRDEMADKARVEGVAGKADTTGGEQLRLQIPPCCIGPQA